MQATGKWQALVTCLDPLYTDVNISAEQIIEWFIRRWQVEVTFHEVRTHLGVEIQRQWADLSILRITSALLGLFSIVTLLANLHAQKQKLPIQQYDNVSRSDMFHAINACVNYIVSNSRFWSQSAHLPCGC